MWETKKIRMFLLTVMIPARNGQVGSRASSAAMHIFDGLVH